MLKMKKMTFFKNPILRDILIVLMAVIIVASIISIPVSNAGSQINVAFRAALMGVSAGKKDIEMPSVAPGQADQNTKEAKYTSVFCIDEGTNLSFAVYNSEYNAYNSDEASKYFKNYGSALWLFDNMYISNSTNKDVELAYLAELVTSPSVAKKVNQYGTITSDNIKALNKTVGGVKDTYGNTVNRNFIEVIEQLALWNYTNNKSNNNIDTYVNAGFSGANINSADQNSAKYLYHALKYLANQNSSYKSNGTVSNVISLDSSKAKIDTSKKLVGPYYLKANNIVLNINNDYKSKISATITKMDKSTQKLDSGKIKVESDGSFYINIKDCGDITKSKLDISAIYTGAKTTVEIMSNGGSTQNLINIRKTANTKPFSDEKTVSYGGKYTLYLKKVKADGTTAITNNPAKFTISGAVTKNGENTGNDGILTIANGKDISSVSATDSYKIVEDEAPKGFTKYDGTINLDVKFKSKGTTFVVDKDNTKLTADGKNGTVKFDVPRENEIVIYVPNTEIETKQPKFDLALRKFITKVDGKAVEDSREPVIDEESLSILEKYKTAAYHHTKQSLMVQEDSLVEYTIRVYNEGEVDGIAKEITDYLPSGLSFVKISDESSNLYTTDAKSDSKKIVIKYKGTDVIKANSIKRILNKETKNVYQEVKVICKVNKGSKGYITNRAEITNYGYTDESGVWHEAKAIGDSDRDSVENTISNSLDLDNWYENAKNYTYTENGTTKAIKDYYPGVQDDDDFETVEVMSGSYKLIIRKVDSSNKNQGLEGAYFSVGTGITTKVGPTDKDGYVDVFKKQVISSPNEKKTVIIKETTAPEGYIGYNKEIKLNIATKESNGKYVIDEENTKIENQDGKVSLDVKSNIITVTIQNDKKDFDLALRKFITNVNNKEITSRIPKVTLTDDFKSGKVTTAIYEHPKDPVDVCTGDIVTYTIRVYNEGGLSGYASKIMDDIPDGLEYLPSNEINTKYSWKMYTELFRSDVGTANTISYKGKKYIETQNASEADVIISDYLKDQLIKGYDANNMNTLDYRDVKVAFKVVEPTTSDRIIINYAQITEHKDNTGKTTVVDRDSIPNEWNEGEDDQDIEKIKLKYFDLALRKWVTEAIITENGQTQVIKTGHKAEDDPEDIVKVDLKKSKLEDVTVKFRYSIRVTNEGEIAGYAKEVSDYIPDGLVFNANDNPGWTQKDAKTVTTDALANTLLNPGESAEVTIVLTWVNDANNMGVKINTAEISKDYNDHGAHDVDSTPGNRKDEEDDIDIAPVMLAVKTGSEAILYVTLGVGFIAILGIGVYAIKRNII